MKPQDVSEQVREKVSKQENGYVQECASILATALRNGAWVRKNADTAEELYATMSENEEIGRAVFVLMMSPEKITFNVLMSDVDFLGADIMGDKINVASCSSCTLGNTKNKFDNPNPTQAG